MAANYRNLLKIAKVFDQAPLLKGLLRPLVPHEAPGFKAGQFLLSVFMDRREYYHPERSLEDFVRAAFRHEDLADMYSQEELNAGMQLLQSYLASIAREVDARVKELGSNAVIPQPAEIPQLGFTLTDEATVGTMLLDHPAVAFPSRGVHLVYDVSQNIKDISGNEDWKIRSFCINRPFPCKVRDAIPEAAEQLQELADCVLFQGGTSTQQLSLLHPFPDIPGSQQIHNTAIFAGGQLDEALKLLRSGKAHHDDFKVLLGSTEWDVDEEEMYMKDTDKVFFLKGDLESTSTVAMLPAIFDRTAFGVDVIKDDLQNEEGYDHQRFYHQNMVWAAVARSLESEYAHFAQLHPSIAEDFEAARMVALEKVKEAEE